MFLKLLYILLAIVVLLVLITVHEFGHYIAGKLLKFKINEFSIGFGPAIYKKKKKNGEIFSIRWLPLGGYCAFEGEDEDNPSKDAFNNQKPWKRIIVLVSGVFFNFLFGILAAVVFLSVSSYAVPKILIIAPNNPNPFQSGDIVTAVDGKKLEIYRSFSDVVSNFKNGEEFVVTVNRDGEIVDLVVSKTSQEAYRYADKLEALEGKVFTASGSLYSLLELDQYIKDPGASLSNLFKINEAGELVAYTEAELVSIAEIVSVGAGKSLGISYNFASASYSFWQALGKAWPFCIYICGLILSALGGLFTGSTAINEVGGTVTAVSQIAEISQISFESFLLLIPLLSMNLALFNILPIPALDGARVVFVFIEWIFKKPVNRKVEGYIHLIGLIVLFALVIFLDLNHFFFNKN